MSRGKAGTESRPTTERAEAAGAVRVGGALPGASPAPQETAAIPEELGGTDPGPRRGGVSWRSGADGYLFLVPYLVIFCVFMLLPLGYGLWLSFMRYEMLSPEAPSFVGLSNYSEALSDRWFWTAAGATGLFVILATPLTLVLALFLAVGIDAVKGRRAEAYKVAVFLPTMLTVSVAGLVWRWFYSRESGLFNAVLGTETPFIDSTLLAMPSIVLMTLWWTVGGPMIILLAGLKQIPRETYEAAAMDGAVRWRRLVDVTLPQLRPVLLFVLVINLIGAFQVFGQTYIITEGGPERSTRVLMQYIYETAFGFYRLGYAAAMSWLLFLVIAVFSVIQFRVMRER